MLALAFTLTIHGVFANRYLGWLLSDKVESVRRSALVALTRVYALETVEEGAAHFSARFKGRIMQCCEDVSEATQAAAVDVIKAMHSIGHLEVDDTELALEMIFASDTTLARAAGELFYIVVIQGELLEAVKTQSPEPVLVLKQVVTRLADLGIDYVEDSKAQYAVDALWPWIPELANWSAYIDLLQQESIAAADEEVPIIDTTLTAEQALLLFEMLGAAANRATGLLRIPGRRVPKLGSKQQLMMEETRTELTEFFVKLLPDLFVKFGAERTSATVLAGLPLTFDLEVYGSARANPQFAATLKHIVALFQRSTDRETHARCASTLEFFTANDLPLQSKAEAVVNTLRVDLIKAMQKALEEGVPTDNGSAPSPASFAATVAMNRISALGIEFEMPTSEIIPSVTAILQRGVVDDVHEDMLVAALELGTMAFGYALAEVANDEVFDAEGEWTVDDEIAEQISKLVKARNEFATAAVQLLEAGTASVQRTSFATVHDLLMIFTGAFADPATHSQFHALSLSLEADVQDRLFTYLTEAVLDHLPSESDIHTKRKTGGTVKRDGKKRRSGVDSYVEDDIDGTTSAIAELTIAGALEAEENDSIVTDRIGRELVPRIRIFNFV